MKYRAISWILIPIGFVVAAIAGIQQTGAKILALNFSINLTLVLILACIIVLYYYIKKREIRSVTQAAGLGDALFYPVLCLLLSPLNFILFNALAFILLVPVLLVNYFKKKEKTIPLAGYLSFFIGILFAAGLFIPELNLYNDTFSINLVHKYFLL